MTATLVTGGFGLAGIATFLILFLYWKGKAATRLADYNTLKGEFVASQKNLEDVKGKLEEQEKAFTEERKKEGLSEQVLVARIEEYRKILAERATAADAAKRLNEVLK